MIASLSGTLTHVVQADTTSERALRQIGAADVVTAVVCIGTDVESSVLTTSALVDLGVRNVWAKAITTSGHGGPKVMRMSGATSSSGWTTGSSRPPSARARRAARRR